MSAPSARSPAAADDLINLRGIKMFPVQIEEAVRALPGSGDEFEIVLSTDGGGLDIMTVRCEHADHASNGRALARRLEERNPLALRSPRIGRRSGARHAVQRPNLRRSGLRIVASHSRGNDANVGFCRLRCRRCRGPLGPHRRGFHA